MFSRRPTKLNTKALAFIFCIGSVSAATITDYASLPPTQGENAAPMVMLVMSRDEQLFQKAYNDYTALDTNPGIDYTYTNTFDYYGYFGSNYCYAYDSTAQMFRPKGLAASGHDCSVYNGSGSNPSARWSGNFLNWASMTRMDIVRRVLYGGARYSDPNTAVTGTNTVLERAMLPTDVHAFAKVYSGSDMNKFTPYTYSSTSLPAITLCNVSGISLAGVGTSTTTVTYASGTSNNLNTSTYPPLILVAKGNNTTSGVGFPLWSASESRECVPGNNATAPKSIDLAMNARIEVCVTGIDAADLTRCRKYSNNNYKPVGLLQRYGENHSLRFGLLTGSYVKKDKGGVLRRNIGYFAGNNTADTTVITADDEINLTTGQFAHDTGSFNGAAYPGIISTLNRIRISQYDFGAGNYADCNPSGITISQFISGSTNTTKCQDWGNPLAEGYLEALNYISGQSGPSSTFDADDSGIIKLPSPLPHLTSWTDPYADIKNRCAHCAIVVLSTGLNTFDADNFASNISSLTQTSLNNATNSIGTSEVFSGNYFIGSNGTTNDGQCNSKPYTSFYQMVGLCPELPQQQGSYQLAGLAYFAHTNDLRSSVAGQTDTTKQTVDTYDIQLAESVPQFAIPGTNVKIMPLCRAQAPSASDRQCTLTNVVINSNFTSSTGTMQITWDDSPFGNDHDMDAVEQLNYCVGSACSPAISAGNVKVTVSKVYAAACDTMKLGYVITGTTNGDGSYIDLTIQHGNNCGGTEVDTVTSGTPSTFTPSSLASSVKLFNNPLWYAAKWGGFDNGSGNNTISQTSQWDVQDLSGTNKTPDGIPDNYFPVSNPAFLESRLGTVFQKLSAQVTSGTAAAVIANSSSGIGALYQAYYNASFVDSNQQQMLWGGVLHAIFVDRYGRLREDLGVKGTLEDTNIDYIVKFSLQSDPNAPLNSGRKVVMYQRYADPSNTGSNDPSLLTAVGSLQPLETFGSVWNARNVLGGIADVTTQRTYTADAGTGRYIFTYLQKTIGAGDSSIQNGTNSGANGVLDGILTDFVASSFPSPSGASADMRYRYLGLADASISQNVVNFIRGQEISSFRSRTVDYPDGVAGNPLPWRLGDIIDSSPVVVGPPDGNYDVQFGDDTYREFKTQYAHRREMVYVGANDGMVHAFNAGVWDPASNTFQTKGHTLGAEMWAYVPMNLLPHLQWLTQNNYSHVYYVDGAPLTFDANIFSADSNHPGGWGTVMVIGMRLGGGAFPLDLDANGSTETTMRSAFMIFDITNPDQPPQLIAELTDQNLGFTTSMPTLIKSRAADSNGSYATPNRNQWYLVFGSGPTSLSTLYSGQIAKIYAYDLVGRKKVTVGAQPTAVASYFGDFSSIDWNSNYQDDAVYAGTVEAVSAACGAPPCGRMERITLTPTDAAFGLGSATAISDLLVSNKPITEKPVLQRNLVTNDQWVMFGTGRLLTTADNSTTQQQTFYGIREPSPVTTVAATTLVDVTGVQVSTAGNVFSSSGGTLSYGSNTITTVAQLAAYISALPNNGWYFNFATPAGKGSERSITEGATYGSSLIFTTYTPSTDACSAVGTSKEYGINFTTGVAQSFSVFGDAAKQPATTINGVPNQSIVQPAVDLGYGMASAPKILGDNSYVNDSGSPIVTKLNSGSGNLGRQSWRYLDILF